MNEPYRISSLRDLFGFVEGLDSESKNWVFRGQAKSEWGLIPKLGRCEFSKNYIWCNYIQQFRYWAMYAENYIPRGEDEWGMLAWAQHHGLPTHFLDWSTNPFVALFFAVNDHDDCDGHLFALNTVNIEYLPISGHQLSDFTNTTRLDEREEPTNDVWLCRLKPRNGRIVNQNSLFTLHINAKKDARDSTINSDKEKAEVRSVVVDKSSKRAILDDLNKFGINYTSVFPDIEGITKQIRFDIANGITRH